MCLLTSAAGDKTLTAQDQTESRFNNSSFFFLRFIRWNTRVFYESYCNSAVKAFFNYVSGRIDADTSGMQSDLLSVSVGTEHAIYFVLLVS